MIMHSHGKTTLLEILSNIRVKWQGRIDDLVVMLMTYRKIPVIFKHRKHPCMNRYDI
jgi:hypothetical protein